MQYNNSIKYFLDCSIISKGNIPCLPLDIIKLIASFHKQHKCINCDKILFSRKKYLLIPAQDGFSIIQNCGICYLCSKPY